MTTLPFIGRPLAGDETLVRVITAHVDPHVTAIAVILQSDGAHLVACRSIRGRHLRSNAFTDLDDPMLDRVMVTLVESVHDGGLETATAEGAQAGMAALEDLARLTVGRPAPRRTATVSGAGLDSTAIHVS